MANTTSQGIANLRAAIETPLADIKLSVPVLAAAAKTLHRRLDWISARAAVANSTHHLDYAEARALIVALALIERHADIIAAAGQRENRLNETIRALKEGRR